MYVDPTEAPTSQLDPHGKPVGFDGIPAEKQKAEALLDVVSIDQKVKVTVLPGLLAD